MLGKNKFRTYNQELKKYARDNRKEMTPAEKKMWDCILRIGELDKYKFLRQKPLGNFIVDFYCSKLNLAIEIDGDTHDKQQDYDLHRTTYLENAGVKVIRFYNSDIMNNKTGVYEHLLGVIEDIEKNNEVNPP